MYLSNRLLFRLHRPTCITCLSLNYNIRYSVRVVEIELFQLIEVCRLVVGVKPYHHLFKWQGVSRNLPGDPDDRWLFGMLWENQGGSTLPNFLEPLSSRGNKDRRIISHEFGVLQLFRKCSNHSTTHETMPAVEFDMSSEWFMNIDVPVVLVLPHSTHNSHFLCRELYTFFPPLANTKVPSHTHHHLQSKP